MTRRPKTRVHSSPWSSVRLALVASLAATVPLLATQGVATESGHGHDHDEQAAVPAKLVQIVREATRQFIDVNAAPAAGYGPFLGCVSGPDEGAMGVHYVNGALVGDGEIDAARPEALIYEPVGDRLRLVGVEFIVDAATWLAHHATPPVLEGQTFQFVSSPNRYALPAFFELHVWAWRHNPNGAFVDWNPRVTCARD
jgi:hypothetical protein